MEKYCPDALWHLAQPLLPLHSERHQGNGRSCSDDRAALAAIRFVLESGARGASRLPRSWCTWAQHAEVRGDLPQPTVAGQTVDGLVLDIDATIVICHSDKESATRTWKKTFGFHPLLCFLDNTGEALAGLLREGRAGSNTTTDHITVLDQALAQIPDAQRHGTPILLRSDSAGSSHGFLAHIRGLRDRHLDIRFSVGAAITEPVRAAIRAVTGWIPAIDTDGDLREHAEVCEITGLLDAAGWPEGTRFLARRERPHPGAQLSLFDTIEGWRHQIVATDTPPGNGSIQHLEARHRAYARVESYSSNADYGLKST